MECWPEFLNCLSLSGLFPFLIYHLCPLASCFIAFNLPWLPPHFSLCSVLHPSSLAPSPPTQGCLQTRHSWVLPLPWGSTLFSPLGSDLGLSVAHTVPLPIDRDIKLKSIPNYSVPPTTLAEDGQMFLERVT